MLRLLAATAVLISVAYAGAHDDYPTAASTRRLDVGALSDSLLRDQRDGGGGGMEATCSNSSGRLGAGAGVSSSTTTAADGTRKPPHILLVVFDDVGWNDVAGFSGDASSLPVAPVIDALIRDGVKLTNFYVTPMCSPTRAALMTGRYPFRYGAQHFVQKPMQPTFVPDSETLLSEKLQMAGYKTHITGKWQ